MKYCKNCNCQYPDSTQFCSQCGSPLEFSAQTPPPYYQSGYERNNYERNNPFDASGPQGKSRGTAALLAIFLGELGVQYFYLGKIAAGILSIILTVVTCGIWGIITLIQGILMFCMSNDEFQRKFVETRSSFPIF